MVKYGSTLGGVVAAACLLAAAVARSDCNVIPGATTTFRGALGSTDRPFATPGDVVSLSLAPGICDAATQAFRDLPGGVNPEDDYRVTVLFTPPQGPRNAVVIATDCSQMGPSSPAI
ncbi:MAG TPA: hypothetical protein VMH82_19230, partial [Myxococcota bacterium]|nr:hypothetical protein [Myxococcota bacterium]